MVVKKFKVLSFGKEVDECEIICTKEEAQGIKYALELAGVNIGVSHYCQAEDRYHLYIRNEYYSCLNESARARFEKNKMFLYGEILNH